MSSAIFNSTSTVSITDDGHNLSGQLPISCVILLISHSIDAIGFYTNDYHTRSMHKELRYVGIKLTLYCIET